MFGFLKLHVLLHWFIIYVVMWIAEEILIRVVVSWFFSTPENDDEPATS